MNKTIETLNKINDEVSVKKIAEHQTEEIVSQFLVQGRKEKPEIRQIEIIELVLISSTD